MTSNAGRCDHPCPNCGEPTRCRTHRGISTTCDACNRRSGMVIRTVNDYIGPTEGGYVDTRTN